MREALAILGVRRVLLGIHDAAWPAGEDDVGRGTPYGGGADELLSLARELGFDGVQLGPQGMTSVSNPSPYDGTFFSRSPLDLALGELVEGEDGGLLSLATLDALVAGSAGAPDRVAYGYAFDAVARAAAEICATVRRRRAEGDARALALAAELDGYRAANAAWLVPDALYLVLERVHGGRHFASWDGPHGALDRVLLAATPALAGAAEARVRELLAGHAEAIEDHALVQLLLDRQHRRLRERARALGFVLYADLQVGMSASDDWATQGFTLRDFRMGAPPSRTNPDGQAWGYPVLDPRRLVEADGAGGQRDGPALRFFRARVRRALADFDGLRVDHPHGLVCPWVYRAGPDPDRAVRAGARLFESPDLADVPELAAFAIARSEQLDRNQPRHGDGWVRSLEPAQVYRYATLVDVIVDEARAGRREAELAFEVLSTLPYPLRRVLERHGLGRFRVTQKVDLANPDDVYRSENARPEDWIQLGNHDTRPIWTVAEGWVAAGAGRAHAEHLAARLLTPDEDRIGWIARVAGDPAALVQARLAELFVGPARNVMIHFTDLFGEREPYNRPGVVAQENWSLRVPPSPRAAFAARLAAGRALDLRRAVATAVHSRGAAFAAAHAPLLRALEGEQA